MPNRVGVYIDHTKAELYSFGDARSLGEADVSRKKIESLVEREPKGMGHVGNVPPQGVGSAEKKHLEHRNREALRKFYDEVIKALADADEIAIGGPGSARTELEQRINSRSDVKLKIRAVEGLDKKLKEGERKNKLGALLGLQTTPPRIPNAAEAKMRGPGE